MCVCVCVCSCMSVGTHLGNFFGDAEWDRNRKRKKRLLLLFWSFVQLGVVSSSPVVVWVQSWLYVGVIVGLARLAL